MNEESNTNKSSKYEKQQSQHSRATSLIKRNASDIEEDDLQYSESGMHTHYFQLEGGINSRERSHNTTALLNNVDMNFIHDINNECNFLITKFQNNNESTKNQQQKQELFEIRKNSLRNQSKDNKIEESKTFQVQMSNKSLQPLNSKQTTLRGIRQNKTFVNDELSSIGGNITATQNKAGFYTGIQSTSHASVGRPTIENATTYEKHSFNNEQHHILEERKIDDRSSQMIVNDPRIGEDSSPQYINNRGSSHYHGQTSSDFNLSDSHSQSRFAYMGASHQNFNNQHSNNNTQQYLNVHDPNATGSFKNIESNKITFRQNESNVFEMRNEGNAFEANLNFPRDDASTENAQFDLQNFNAFNQNIVDHSDGEFSRADQSSSQNKSHRSQQQQRDLGEESQQQIFNKDRFSDQQPSFDRDSSDIGQSQQQIINQSNMPNRNVYQIQVNSNVENVYENKALYESLGNQQESIPQQNQNAFDPEEEEDDGDEMDEDQEGENQDDEMEQSDNDEEEEGDDEEQEDEDQEEEEEDEEDEEEEDQRMNKPAQFTQKAPQLKPPQDEREYSIYHEREPDLPTIMQQEDKLEQSNNQQEDSFNDEKIYNRLPKNFFVQEEEHKDLDIVMSSIKQMRQDFIGYINESNIHEQLEELQNIIQPEKFIQKHFGEVDENALLEEVIKPIERPVESKQSDKDSLSVNNEFKEALSSKGNVDEIEDRLKKFNEAIKEEDDEDSPEKITTKFNQQQPRMSNVQSSYNVSYFQSLTQNQGSPQKSVKSIKQKAITDLPLKSYENTQSNKRHLKMADYFKEKSPKQAQDFGELASNQYQDDDEPSISAEQKEHLVQKMEQDILGNIDINFLFCKGENLRNALIDQSRIFKIMQKIKEVAKEQVEKGLKEIDYKEIVKYLREEELYSELGLNNSALNETNYAEPMKSKIPEPEISPEQQWVQIVDFMRKNPKLMLQMLPDNSDEEKQSFNPLQTEQQKEEAKKWSKLQALSNTFLHNRKNFLNAIDQIQLKGSSPKTTANPLQKERKNIQIKSITNNHKKIKMAKKGLGLNDSSVKGGDGVQSDGEYFTNKELTNAASSGLQSRQMQYIKQFQYTSANTAKNIYSNAPFIQGEVNDNNNSFLAQKIQENLNSNRPAAQSQQMARSKQPGKKASMSSMADHSTVGTTATGHLTNLNYYMFNKRDQISSQNQTINFENEPNNGNNILNQAKQAHSQRRPITANVTTSKNKSLAFMQPILQQRQESMEKASNKIGGVKRGSRMSQGPKIQNYRINSSGGQQNDLSSVNEFANTTYYFSQGGVNDAGSQSVIGGAGQDNTLNQSDFMPYPINQSMQIVNLGPSKKTQKFISKMAPQLKENEHFPKFITRVRERSKESNHSTYSNGLNKQQRGAHGLNESVSSSFTMNQLRQRKLFDYQQQKFENTDQSQQRKSINNKLNQSASHIMNDNQSDTNEKNEYSYTPQGIFPKFVKRQMTSQSAQSRKVVDQETQSHRRENVTQGLQTRIGGLNNKLLISPISGVHDPFITDGEMSQISKQDSQITDQKFSKKHVVLPIIDWAFTPLFQKCLEDDTEFNKEQDMSVCVEKEVDYVIEMMKNKYKDFKRSDIMRPFFLKAQQTLRVLYHEQSIVSMYEKTINKYKEITIENTMKLLIRSKLAFHSRQMVIEILQILIKYELDAVEFKNLIDKFDSYRVASDDYQKIQTSGQKLFEMGHQLLVKIKTLRSIHKQYKTPFIFKKKDYVNYVKSEMSEVKKLLSIFKLRGENEGDNAALENLMVSLKQIEENKNETTEQSQATERHQLQ